MNYKKSSSCFRSEQDFFSMKETAFCIRGLICLAWCGQTEIQRMQEMQSSLSIFAALVLSIAPTGQFAAQIPQFTHCFVGLGTTPAPLAFLYGRCPGISDTPSFPSSSFCKICFAKECKVSSSAPSGLPAANCRAIECSATAATAPITEKPAFDATSCNSASVSS